MVHYWIPTPNGKDKVVGFYDHITDEGRNEWHRLNRCKAAVLDARLDGTKFIGLVSYETPVAYLTIGTDEHSQEVVTVVVNRQAWRCSPTTIQHVSRFFKWVEENYHIRVNYLEVKEAFFSPRMHFTNRAYIFVGTLYTETSDEMRRTFNALGSFGS